MGDIRTEQARQTSGHVLGPRIVKLELIVTDACNLRCTYCFARRAPPRGAMSRGSALGAVDFLLKASRDASSLGISFMGGEPLLCFDLIREVIEHGKRRGAETGKRLSFDLTTNGVLLTEEHARYFRSVGLRYLLSLDGTSADHDRHRRTQSGAATYEIIAEKMHFLKPFQPWQGARITVMPNTAERLAENVKSLHEDLRINQFIIGLATSEQWTDEQIAAYNLALKETFEYYLWQRITAGSRRLRIGLLDIGELSNAHDRDDASLWGCGAGSGRVAVAPDGTFHGCARLAWGRSGRDDAPLPLGSVDSGLDRWENRRRLLDHSLVPRRRCQRCELRRYCSGGCYATNYVESGNIYMPSDAYCKLIFAQKDAADYGRQRLEELGLERVSGGTARL